MWNLVRREIRNINIHHAFSKSTIIDMEIIKVWGYKHQIKYRTCISGISSLRMWSKIIIICATRNQARKRCLELFLFPCTTGKLPWNWTTASAFSLCCHAFLCQPEDEMVQTRDFTKNRTYVKAKKNWNVLQECFHIQSSKDHKILGQMKTFNQTCKINKIWIFSL